MIGWEVAFLNLEWRTYQKTNSDRTLRDGTFRKRIPGSELPGYVHLLAPGRNPRPVHKIDSTSRAEYWSSGVSVHWPCPHSAIHIKNTFEDEDDDESEDE